MPRLLRTGLFLALVLGAGPCPRAAAEDKELEALKKDVFDAKKQWLRARAEKEAWEVEKKAPVVAPEAESPALPAGTAVGVPETLRNILKESDALNTSRKERNDALGQLLKDTTAKSTKAEDLCREATYSRMKLLGDLAAEEQRLGLRVAVVNPDLRIEWVSSQVGLAWDGPAARQVFWLWLLATASLWLCTHLMRRQRRRWWRQRGRLVRLLLGPLLAAAALAWVGLLGAAVFTLVSRGVPPVGPAEAPRQALQETLRSAQENWRADREAEKRNNESLGKEIEAARVAALQRWGDSLGLPKSDPKETEPEKSEYEAAGTLHKILVEVHAARLFAEDAAAGALEEEQARKDLPGQVAGRAENAPLWGRVRLAGSAAVVLLAFVPPLALEWRRRRRLRGESKRCPRCLDYGRLSVVNAPVRDHRYPDPKYVLCAECAYEFRTGQLRVPRLCFPTVGPVASGKTHWLLETYGQVKEQRLPTAAAVSPALSLGDDQSALDEMVRLVREECRNPRATQAAEGTFPHPITVQVQDRGSSPSDVLLNLFDFGGEMTTRHLKASLLRRRALMMDGFLFFIDPTRPPEDQASQQDGLLRFAQDVRHMHELPEGARIDMPVAVCLPKLDLLPTQTEFSGRARAWLRRLRQTRGRAVTPALLRERSRLVREALVTLFPRWPVEKDLRDNFGHNFLFFPMTPVGLEERELGGADPAPANPREHAVAPFGIGEPVLWLLHVHGYRVLA